MKFYKFSGSMHLFHGNSATSSNVSMAVCIKKYGVGTKGHGFSLRRIGLCLRPDSDMEPVLDGFEEEGQNGELVFPSVSIFWKF